MVTSLPFCEGTQLTTAAATLFTCPVNTAAVIKKATVTNTTAGAVTVTVYKIASGGSANAANTITYQKAIPAGAVVELYELENHVLAAGDFVQALASAAASVSIALSGVQIV